MDIIYFKVRLLLGGVDMLFIIDMQNDYVDRKQGKNYVTDSEKIVEGIINKIKEYEGKGEYIFYTSDIPIKENKDNFKKGNNELEKLNDKESIETQEKKSNKEEKWGCEPYHLLKPYLDKHERVKKSYYGIPPETLLKFQKEFKGKNHITEEIEFVGVETNICVLANAICFQSAFPHANIIIDSSLCKSKDNKDHENTLQVMEGLGMKIRR